MIDWASVAVGVVATLIGMLYGYVSGRRDERLRGFPPGFKYREIFPGGLTLRHKPPTEHDAAWEALTKMTTVERANYYAQRKGAEETR